MIYSVSCTLFAVLNLLFFVIGIASLPENVPIRFGADLLPKAVGSPWVYAAFPAAAALVSAALFLVLLLKGERLRNLADLFLSLAGAALIVLGWTFFGLIQSAASGVRAEFPYSLVIVLPISLLLVLFGGFLPRFKLKLRSGIFKNADLRPKILRLYSVLFVISGLISAIICVLLTCLCRDFAFLSSIVLSLTFVAALLSPMVYARKIAAKTGDADFQRR